MLEGSKEEIVSLVAVNREAAYEVSFVESKQNVLLFVTDKGLVYNITFVVDNTLGLPHLYQLVIEEITGNRASHDVKVEQTLVAVLNSFLADAKRVLTFVCDTRDMHEKARNKLFHRWYLKYRKIEWEKLDGVVCAEESVYYSSVIYNRNNPNTISIQETYTELISELQK